MGFLRLALALSVVAAHTGGKLWVDGRTAVLLFYVISGFLITLVLDRTYRDDRNGFYLNRALRIFVPAVVVFALGVVAFGIAGVPSPIGEAPTAATMLFSLLSNLLIVPQDLAWLFAVAADGRIVWQPYGETGTAASLMLYQYNQPLFTVAIELYFYLLAPFVVRTPGRALAFAWVGLGYHLATQALGVYSIAANYHVFVASWLYFGSGAVAYWLFKGTDAETTQQCYTSLVAFSFLQLGFDKIGLPVAFMVLVLALPSLLEITRKVPLDDYIASYSYLVYLVHWPVHVVLQHMGGTYGVQGPQHFGAVAAVSLALAALLHHLVERPLDELRGRVRRRATPARASGPVAVASPALS